MSMMELEKRYNLSRKAASKLLKVSIRTLDRYLKMKKLSTKVVNGRIWLDKDEIEGFDVGRKSATVVDSVDMSTSRVSMDVDMDRVDNVELIDDDIVDMVSTKKRKPFEGSAYKKLYFEMKEDLREKQERLEIANYRVGQLETQVRNSIPMLEYHRETFETKKREEDLQQKLEESTGLMKKLASRIKEEKFSKRIFLIILLAVLALQPLWLLLLSGKP